MASPLHRANAGEKTRWQRLSHCRLELALLIEHPTSLCAAGGVFCVDEVAPSPKQPACPSLHPRLSLVESLKKHFQNWCGLGECKESGKSRALLKMSEQSIVVRSSGVQARTCVYVF